MDAPLAHVKRSVPFIDGKALNASQIDFVNLVTNHLTEHGVMEAGRLSRPSQEPNSGRPELSPMLSTSVQASGARHEADGVAQRCPGWGTRQAPSGHGNQAGCCSVGAGAAAGAWATAVRRRRARSHSRTVSGRMPSR